MENLLLALMDTRMRLDEAEETLRAIRCHEVDALVVGDQVYTLQSAERPYRILIEQMQEGALTVSSDGTIIYCNPRFADMMGVPYEDVIAHGFTEFVSKAQRPRLERVLREGAIGIAKHEFELVTATGSIVDTILTIAPLPTEGDGHVCIVATDLTEQKQKEEIIAAELLARSILEHVAEAVVVCDRSGVIIRSSRAAADLAGLDVTSMRYHDAFRLKYVGAETITGAGIGFPIDQALAGSTLTGIPAELPVDGADRPLYVLVSAGPLTGTSGDSDVDGCIITMTDITRQKKLEYDLAAASEKDHRIAESLQRSLLLKPARNQFPSMEIEPFYKAAWDESQLGGDFFDTFALEHGRVALVVGDVSGKGLAAATRTAEIKFTLRAYLREHPDPAHALERLNIFFCEALELDNKPFAGFVCITLAVVHPSSGDIAFASAGMEEPLIVRRDGSTETITARGAVLGVDKQAPYEPVEGRVRPGDLLLMMTDGVTEARSGRDLFGYDRLVAIAKQAASAETLEGTVHVIVDGAQRFAGGKFQDDVCVLATRFL